MELADDIARTILSGFDKHYRLFREVSAEARERFETRAWAALGADSRRRIDMYDRRVAEAVEATRERFPEAFTDEHLWPPIKQAYVAQLYGHKQPELAETFFNSVACRILQRRYYSNEHIFWRPAVAAENIDTVQLTWRAYFPGKVMLHRTLRDVLGDFGLRSPLAHPGDDARAILRAIRVWFPRRHRMQDVQVQVLSSLFFRNRAAYIVGRVLHDNEASPFVVALRHGERGVYVDALVHRREHLTNLLSLSHTYFMVNMEAPSAWVSFLQSLVPAKPKAELYTALGLQKQGKTLFYRDLHDHLKHTTDRFVVAPGTRGMVMAVFTLPSFPYVFKCIRDHFDPPKDTSREEVKAKYLLAKHHDRIGRMSDTFEYSDVALPRDRFDPDLLVELRKKIPSLLAEEGDRVILRHLYIEQRLIPLDVYVRDALVREDETQLRRGVDELGQSLRELAEVNIFPGDLLPKNFGLTRYGRMVFYDYDEMTYLTSCNFRRIPKAPGYDEETSGEAWFSVDAGDVFPEEFSTFLFPPGPARELFRELHGDLLDPAFWIAAQKRVKSGTEVELLPYPESTRLSRVKGQRKKASLYP